MSDKIKQVGIKSYQISKYKNDIFALVKDQVAIEAPLLISLKYPNVVSEELVITMQTPVHTQDLVVGFLYSEGIIDSFDQITSIELQPQNALVTLSKAPIKKSERGTVSTAACGMCGKTSLDAIDLVRVFELDPSQFKVHPTVLLNMSIVMRAGQTLFDNTGGIHAAGLFAPNGQLITLREDIGRHNAVDKAIGQLIATRLDRTKIVLFVSGRAGFELVQKALVAGISMMVAVGAPSSLAVDFARQYGMTLVGFLQKDRFNIYSHPERIVDTSQEK